MIRKLMKGLIPPAARAKLRAHQPGVLLRKRSYSQCGEDLLVAFALELIHGKRPMRYLDVGANHPFKLSNTALLYEAGGEGILVEPDPCLSSLLVAKRPRDTVMECGVHFSGGTHADFFVIEPPTLNTFSRQEMERYVGMGHALKQTIKVRLENINHILEQAGSLDFMNLDIEGLDKKILEMIDWERFRPTCICVETISYERENEPIKLNDMIELMENHDYFQYADTFINTIFIDRRQWLQRWDQA